MFSMRRPRGESQNATLIRQMRGETKIKWKPIQPGMYHGCVGDRAVASLFHLNNSDWEAVGLTGFRMYFIGGSLNEVREVVARTWNHHMEGGNV